MRINKNSEFYRFIRNEFIRIASLPHTETTTIIEEIQDLLKLIDDPDSCLNNCKGMYFCRLKKGHEGKHNDYGLTW